MAPTDKLQLLNNDNSFCSKWCKNKQPTPILQRAFNELWCQAPGLTILELAWCQRKGFFVLFELFTKFEPSNFFCLTVMMCLQSGVLVLNSISTFSQWLLSFCTSLERNYILAFLKFYQLFFSSSKDNLGEFYATPIGIWLLNFLVLP